MKPTVSFLWRALCKMIVFVVMFNGGHLGFGVSNDFIPTNTCHNWIPHAKIHIKRGIKHPYKNSMLKVIKNGMAIAAILKRGV